MVSEAGSVWVVEVYVNFGSVSKNFQGVLETFQGDFNCISRVFHR